MVTERVWSVYVLFDSRAENLIRYVGITANTTKRLLQHQNPRKSDQSRRAKWVLSVIRSGGQIILHVISTCKSSRGAELEEINEISRLKALGCDLVNGTDGGGGLLNPTEDVRRRLSISVSATRTDDFKKRMSVIMSAKVNPDSMALLSAAIKAGKSTPLAKDNDKLAKRMKPPLSNNLGKFKGVSYHKKINRWCGRIKLDGKNEHLGTFKTPEEAARAYDLAAFAAWGSNCYLNFPADIAA